MSQMVSGISDLRTDFASLHTGQAKIDSRVVFLEARQKEDTDLAAAALTRAKGCEPYTLVLSDIPVHPYEFTPDLMVTIGAACDVKFTAEYISEFWRPKPRNSRQTEPPPANLSSSLQAQPTTANNRPPDRFVKFRYAQLRDALLSKIRELKGIKINYPRLDFARKIKAYEVLTGDRHFFPGYTPCCEPNRR